MKIVLLTLLVCVAMVAGTTPEAPHKGEGRHPLETHKDPLMGNHHGHKIVYGCYYGYCWSYCGASWVSCYITTCSQGITVKPIQQGVYIDLGKAALTSDKIKLYVRKNLTAAFCDMVGQFTRERLIHVLF